MEPATSAAPPNSPSPANSTSNAAEAGQPSKKGTGVFFGPALASRLAGSRSGSSRKQGVPNRSQSSSGSLGVNRNSSAGGAGREDDLAGASKQRGGPRARRQSTSMELPPRNTGAQHLLVSRSTSFTAGVGSSSAHGAVMRPGSHSMPGGPELNMFQTLLSSPQAGVASQSATPFAAGAVQSGPNLIPLMPNQQLALQQHQQHQQQQQQFALEHELLQQEQQRLQEVQRLQAELQQLLQQQQVRMQQHTPPNQQMQLDAMTHNITDTGCAGAITGQHMNAMQASPTLLAQLQARPSQQQLLGEQVHGSVNQQAVLGQGPFAVLSCPADALSSDLQQSCSLSISAMGRPAGNNPSTACGLPNLQSADLAAVLQQKLQLQQANQGAILQGTWSAQGAAEAAAAADDDAQVAALDGLINQCLARMLQLRSQMAARRAPAAATIGSTCSTPTTTTAGAVLTTGAEVLSSAAAFTSDSILMQPQAASSHSQPAMQQQLHNRMLSPMSSVGAPLQQQMVNIDGRVVWVQQHPNQHQQQAPVHASAGMAGSASGLALSPQISSACQPLQQGGSSYCVQGGVGAQSMPMLVQQQGHAILQQAGGVALMPAYSMGDGAQKSGYFSPTAGPAGPQGLSPVAPGWQLQNQGQHMPMQAGPQGMVQQLSAGSNRGHQLDEQQLQQLQQLLAQQRLQGLLN